MTPHDLISADQIALCRSRFSGPRLSMVLDAIEAGNALLQLWEVPLGGGEPALVLWDRGNNVLYLTGDAGDDDVFQTLASALAEQVLTPMRAAGVRWVKLCPHSALLRERVSSLFPNLELHLHRYLFHVQDSAHEVRAATTPDGITFAPITAEVLSGDTHAGSKEVRAEIQGMWPSEERFYRRGLGMLALKDGDIICWCTAEYSGPTYCGIGIETRPDQERKGIATAVTLRFVEEARRRGLTPCWECDSRNIPSVRVAEKTGFVLQAEETYWIASLRSPQG